MKRLGSYIFLLTLVVHTFSQVVIIGEYFINQDYIAAVLCENKDEPEMECNGKCYLKKELKKDEERKGDEKTTKVEVLLFCEVKLAESDAIIDFQIEKTESSIYLSRRLSSGYHQDIFHPPC